MTSTSVRQASWSPPGRSLTVMTRRSDGDGEPACGSVRGCGAGAGPESSWNAGSNRGSTPAGSPSPSDLRTTGNPETHETPAPSVPRAADRPALAGWLAPTLWILAVAFPAAGLGLRALAARIATSMPYSSFGDPLGERWLLDAVPLLVTLAPGVVAGGPLPVIAALAVHALRRRPARAASDDREAGVPRA